MDPVVAAGFIGGGAAVLAAALTAALSVRITTAQIRSSEKLSRQTFLQDRQADTYIAVCEGVGRIRAWAGALTARAAGIETGLQPPEILSEDRWFQLQAQLRAFGSRMVRDEFDAMMKAAHTLRLMDAAGRRGVGPEADDFTRTLQEVMTRSASAMTAVSAEVGPLADLPERRSLWRPSTWPRRSIKRFGPGVD